MRKLVCCMFLASACQADVDPLEGVTTKATTGPGPATTGSTSAGTDESTGSGSSGASTEAVTTTNPTTTGGDGLTTMPEPGSSSSSGVVPMCLAATDPCEDVSQCCEGLECATTSLGQVCCGLEGASCATPNGEDCCGALLCIAGACGYDAEDSCQGPCTVPPALALEKQRLADIGGSFLGVCGDANHTYGYHVPAANLPADDYSLEGAANDPVCEWHAAAIDIGMDWPVSREWLKWLIMGIASDEIQGIAEVIGSYDGVDVRYWSDSSGWSVEGVPYQGSGHDTWTHVAIYRSTALQDHGILAGWTANGGP